MLLRRLLWLVVALLGIALVAAALVPRNDQTTTSAPVVVGPERATVKSEIAASPAQARTISARVGDHLELTVESDRIDTVTIDGLDQTRPVDPASPAEFDTLLDHAGRFAVRMQDTRRTVGFLSVKPTD
jgi:hypothetical protein